MKDAFVQLIRSLAGAMEEHYLKSLERGRKSVTGEEGEKQRFPLGCGILFQGFLKTLAQRLEAVREEGGTGYFLFSCQK